MPMVTVVIPTLNRFTFIDAAIESFEMQKGNHELIIVDDGGTAQYTEKMKKYVVRREHNGGTPVGMNTGFKLARGKYVTTIGDDDLLIGEDSLNVRASMLEKTGADLVYTDAIEIDGYGKFSKDYKRGEATKEFIWKSDCINLHSMMWRVDVHEKVGYLDEDLKFDEDWAWKIRLIHEARCVYMPVVTAATRYHSGNKTFGEGRAGVLRDHATMLARLKQKYGVK